MSYFPSGKSNMSAPLTKKRSQMTYRQWQGGDGGQDEISFLNEPLYQGVLVIKTQNLPPANK